MLTTMTNNPPTTKTLNTMLGMALKMLAEVREPRLICDMPFFSIICDRKLVNTVNNISGMNFDIV